MSHTPTPWNVENGALIIGGNKRIVDTWRLLTPNDGPEAFDNARLIVRAVNSFEAMKAALQEMLDYASARNSNPQAKTVNMKFSRLTLEMWQKKAKAAILLAEGKELEP